MNGPLRNYLKKMAKHIRSRSARREAYREIAAHLDLSIEDRMKSSKQNLEEVTRDVLASATDPEVLGRRLNRAHRPWYWKFPILSVSLSSLVLSFLALVIFSNLALSPKNLLPMSANVQILEEQYAAFEDDLELIAKSPIFFETARKRNAHQAIASYVAEGSVVCQDVLENSLSHANKSKDVLGVFAPSRWLALALESGHPETVLRRTISEQLDAACRPGWIQSLQAFDHWNFYQNREFAESFQSVAKKGSVDKLRVWSSSDQPKILSELRKMALREAFRMITVDRSREGLTLMRHVASLLNSTRTLRGQIEAARLIKHEAQLATILKIDSWPSVPLEVSQAYERLGWGWAQILSTSFLHKSFPKRWLPYAFPEFGMCGGLTESPLGPEIVGDFLGKGLPFEGSLEASRTRATLQTRQRFEDCGIVALEPLLVHGDRRSGQFFGPQWLRYWTILDHGEESLLRFLPNPARLPFLRRIVGAILVSQGSPNYMQVYGGKVENSGSY